MSGNQRCYVPVSLVDDTGIDEVILSMSRLMMKDLNLSVSSVVSASESTIQWSKARKFKSTGSDTKSFRVLLLVLNSSVFKKFEEALDGSIFQAIQTGSVDSTDEMLSDTNSGELPIFAIAGAPTISDGQKVAMNVVATKHSVPCIITVPRTFLDALEQCRK